MVADPYTTLGVKRDATTAQIKSAYLKLAKKHHPDLNPGDKKAEEKFKGISAAHDLLGDPEKRAKFDSGEIDATGQAQGPRPGPGRQSYRGFADTAQGGRYHAGAGGADGFQDMFADLFAQARGGGGGQMRDQPMRGQDQRFALSVSFIEAALGASRRLTLPDGRTLDVTIPAGLESGQTLRLRGQGAGGWNGGPPGDALIEVEVAPHPFFERDGDDIHLDLPVTAAEAALGGKVAVPTPAGPVNLSIPKHSDSGRQLRLRGRGIPARGTRPAGDALIEVEVAPHPFFERDGDDIHLDLPVTAAEAALGGKVAVPTPAGPVNLSIPKHSDSGRQLRLRGRGIPARGTRPAGDLYVTLRIVLGTPDAALEEALQAFYERHPLDPRAHMGEPVSEAA